MMHCMVNCRQMVGQKKAGINQEPLLSGLATLIPPDKLQSPKKHPNQRLLATPEGLSDITFGKENAPLVNCATSEKIENGASRWDRNVGSILRTGPLLHKASQLGNRKRHSPYRKVADVREARRASLDRKSEMKNTGRIFRKPAICSSTILSFRDDRRVIPVPEKLMADDTTGKFAYISLDGRLINGELATSTRSIGGGLGQQEVQVWEGFAPIQRVLVVAVAAAVAAAAAAKHKNSKEIDKLLKTIQGKDNEILSMRQQLSLTCTQSTTSSSVLPLGKEQIKLTPLAATTVSRSTSPMAAADHRSAKEIERLLKTIHEKDTEILSMRQQLRLTWKQSNVSPSVLTLTTKSTPLALTTESKFFSPIGSVRSSSEIDHMNSKLLDFTVIPEAENVNSQELPDASVINKGVVLVETSSRGNVSEVGLSLQHEEAHNEAEEAAKWYVNPMVLEPEDRYFDMCTPERGNPLFAACTPAVRGSLEWMALRSSFKNWDSITSTPVPQLLPFAEFPFVSPAQVIATCDTNERCLSSKLEDVDKVHQDLTASRVLCAGVILGLKKELVAALDTEVSRFRAAVLAGLEEGTDPVEAMHLVLARCWQDITPKALSEIGLSPSEFENYQLHHRLKGSRNLDNILKLEEGIQAWREYMKAHCSTDVSIRQPTNGETPTKLRTHSIDASSPSQNVVREDFQKLRATVLSASGAEVKITACIPSPDHSGPRKSITFSAKSGHQGFGFPKNSTEYVSEQLLGELHKATAHVAEMEIQIKRLEQTVAEADAKRQEAEKKLIASTKQGLENQARQLKGNADKKKELRLREVKIAGLEGSHKIMLVAKNNEIVTLRRDCNQCDTLYESEAAVQPTITANTGRIAELEDVCRGKDSTIYELKQEIVALESKLHAFRTFQSPAMLRGRRSFMPIATSPVNDYTTAINGLHKQEPFKEIPTPPFLAPSNPVQQVFEGLQTGPSTTSNQDRNDHSLQVQNLDQDICKFKHDSLRDNYSQLVSSSTDFLAHTSSSQQAKAMEEDDDKRNDQCKPNSTRDTLSSMQASPSRAGSLGLEDGAIEFSAPKQSIEDVSVDPLHQCPVGPREEHYSNKNECRNHAGSNTQQVKAMDDDKHNDQWKPKTTKNALCSMRATSPNRDGFSGIQQSGGAIEFSAQKQLLETVSVDLPHQCLEGPKKEDYANKHEGSSNSISSIQQAKTMDDDKHNDQWNRKSTWNVLISMQATSPSRDSSSGIEQSGEEGGEIEFSELKQSLEAVSVDPLHQCLEGPHKEPWMDDTQFCNYSSSDTHHSKAIDDSASHQEFNPKSTRDNLISLQEWANRDGSTGIEQSGEKGGEIDFSELKESLEAVSVDPLHQCLEGPRKEPWMDDTQFCNYSSSDTHHSKAIDDSASHQEFNPKSTRNNLISLQESASTDYFSGLGQSCRAVPVELKHSLEDISVHPQESTTNKNQDCEYSNPQKSKAVDDDSSNQELKPKRSRNDFSGCEQSSQDISRLSPLEAVSLQHFGCVKREPLTKKNQYSNYSARNTLQSNVMDRNSVPDFKPISTRDIFNLKDSSQLSSSKGESPGLEQLSLPEHSTEAVCSVHQHFGGPKKEALTNKNQYNSYAAGKKQQFKIMSYKSFEEFKPKSTRDNWSSLQLLSSSRDGFPKFEQSRQAVLVDKECSPACGPCVPENTTKPSAFNHMLSKEPKATIEVCRVSTSSLNLTSNLNRVRASVTFTSSTKTMETSKAKDSRTSNKSTKNAKRMDGKKNSRTSPGSVDAKVLGSVAPNTPIKNRNASSMDLKGGTNSTGGGDPGSKENSATKRRRWV